MLKKYIVILAMCFSLPLLGFQCENPQPASKKTLEGTYTCAECPLYKSFKFTDGNTVIVTGPSELQPFVEPKAYHYTIDDSLITIMTASDEFNLFLKIKNQKVFVGGGLTEGTYTKK